MGCQNCPQPGTLNMAALLDKKQQVMRKANDQCKSQGVASYGLYRTANDNPGYAWWPVGHEALKGREDVEYFTVSK